MSRNNNTNRDNNNKKNQPVIENAKPTSYTELPPLPPGFDTPDYCAILLFYQYVEPLWTSSQHKRALKKLMELCQTNRVTGRGRVAPEGLNCTLTGPGRGIRAVCQGLRDYDQLFWETDFKITDGVPVSKQFKSLSVRKTEELVAYGLKGDAVAPSLTKFAGEHLEANEYHQALQDPDAVVVDVRNFYETALGAFNPPPGGAELIDPKLRNSIEFPKWLAAPETQKKLDGKKVLMYCTGGIRCERATALLNQMVTASQDNSNQGPKTTTGKDPAITCKPKGVFELRGGIERYVKTFPQGGFWRGKNYLFDRRMEQIPEGRDTADVEAEINAKCCLCLQKWTSYRGQYSCAAKLCGVPVIVCNQCTDDANLYPNNLQCDLCRDNYRLTVAQPDLAQLKRKAEERTSTESATKKKKTKHGHQTDSDKSEREHYSDRLFVSRLPLTVTVTKLKELLLPSHSNNNNNNNNNNSGNFKVCWLTDPQTKAFYGSCVIQMPNADLTKKVLERVSSKNLRMGKKVVKVSGVWKKKDAKEKDVFWNHEKNKEYPPIQ